jgi:hypothetical protein
MFAFFEDLTRDIRFGVRNLQKSAGLALMTGVSIALGIGATTAMYSVIYAVLLDPFPYKDVAHLLQRQSANGYGRLRRQLGTVLQHGRRSATLVMSRGEHYSCLPSVPEPRTRLRTGAQTFGAYSCY